MKIFMKKTVMMKMDQTGRDEEKKKTRKKTRFFLERRGGRERGNVLRGFGSFSRPRASV